MTNDAVAYSLRHVTALKGLLEALQHEAVEFYEHSYDYLAFGNWMISAGRRKRRYRFYWDGRDSYLSVETATYSDSHTHTEWVGVPEHSGPATSAEALQKAQDILKHAV